MTARSAISRLSSWITSVLSIAVPPVDRLPVDAQVEDLPGGQHGVEREAGEREQALRLVVDLQAGEHLLVADAAPGIVVDDLDQLGDGVPAVAHDVPRNAPGDRHDAAVDDQDAMVLARLAGLDDHPVRKLVGLFEGRPHLVQGFEDRRSRPSARPTT